MVGNRWNFAVYVALMVVLPWCSPVYLRIGTRHHLVNEQLKSETYTPIGGLVAVKVGDVGIGTGRKGLEVIRSSPFCWCR